MTKQQFEELKAILMLQTGAIVAAITSTNTHISRRDRKNAVKACDDGVSALLEYVEEAE